MTHADERGHATAGDLGAHALRLLGPREADAVERHLVGCAECRLDLAELRDTAQVLDVVPPEMFLDGPPDTDLVLQRALRVVRLESAGRARSAEETDDISVDDRPVPRRPVAPAPGPPDPGPLDLRGLDLEPPSTVVAFGPRSERRERERTRRPMALVAAAVVGAGLLLGTGSVIGRATAPESTVTAAADGRVLEGTSGDVTMRAVVVPASGWVRLNAEVRGIPPNERCTLVVTARDGSETIAGSWLTSPSGGVVNGSALVAPDDVVAVTVRNDRGQEFITVAA